MASDNTEGSEATKASFDADDPTYETALNKRFIFLYKGKPGDAPKDLVKSRAVVFAINRSARTPKK